MFLSKPDLCYLFKSFIIIFSASQHNFSWVFLTLVVFNYCNAFSRFNTLILIFFEFLNSSSNCNMSLDFIKDVYITLQETFLCYPASSWLKWIGLHFSFLSISCFHWIYDIFILWNQKPFPTENISKCFIFIEFKSAW